MTPPTKRIKSGVLKSDLVGLMDPLDDPSLLPKEIEAAAPTEEVVRFGITQVVWAKMVGYKPLWTPAIITAVGSESKQYFVIYVMGSAFQEPPSSSAENTTDSNRLPQWFIEEKKEEIGHRLPTGIQFAWIPAFNLKCWEGDHKYNFIQAISKLDPLKKRNAYIEAVSFCDRMAQAPNSIPSFIHRDADYRMGVMNHTQSVAADLAIVRPALKLIHLKLFLESNMIELHWRTISYAREFVRAVEDDVFGGYHLIAAQDWPTDEQVDTGKFPEVILMYPGAILTADEAAAMEVEERNGIHLDRNRYVAEIPNTCEILDKSGKVNVNPTGKNLFVDGLKYSDPTSPCWAPGPTVNHERTQYCKLEPHHVSGNEPIRGFWLQRKRGEIITKGEPLFWSYDCGAGKFDADYSLDQLGPPIGWISTAEIKEQQDSLGGGAVN